MLKNDNIQDFLTSLKSNLKVEINYLFATQGFFDKGLEFLVEYWQKDEVLFVNIMSSKTGHNSSFVIYVNENVLKMDSKEALEWLTKESLEKVWCCCYDIFHMDWAEEYAPKLEEYEKNNND